MKSNAIRPEILLGQFMFLLFAMTSCCTNKTVYCGADKSQPVFVPRKFKCVYQDYVKTRDVGVKASIDILGKIKVGDVSTDVKSKVTELQEKLNNSSIRIRELLKANFTALMVKPCESSQNYYDFLRKVSDDNIKLEELNKELSKVLGNGIAGPDNNKIVEAINSYEKNSTVVGL